MNNIKPCPKCKTAWLYSSDHDYYSTYESFGFKINCHCGYAWTTTKFENSKEEVIMKWNKVINNVCE